jgi:hypothetical protein
MSDWETLYYRALGALDGNACMALNKPCSKIDCYMCWDEYLRKHIRCSFSPSICSLQSGRGNNYCSCTEKCEYQR